MRPVTARGFRDVLPAEAAEREAASSRIAEVFSAWGYGLVETPVVEDLAALEAAAGALKGTAFRLIDLDGRLLALRPDMTLAVTGGSAPDTGGVLRCEPAFVLAPARIPLLLFAIMHSLQSRPNSLAW